MSRKVGGKYRDQYYDAYFDYLRDRTDKERKLEGKAPYSDVTIKTYATDTFYLEKHDDRDFGDWLKDNKNMDEAYKCLVKNLYTRKNPEKDAIYYLNCMKMFDDFLKNNQK